jgi:hypothetical protein
LRWCVGKLGSREEAAGEVTSCAEVIERALEKQVFRTHSQRSCLRRSWVIPRLFVFIKAFHTILLC